MSQPIGVTITGADDNVDPQMLVDLSKEFPFVEWGILLSISREGTPRYPSNAWMDALGFLVGPDDAAISAHCCGRFARDIVAGRAALGGLSPMFCRAQINGYEPGATKHLGDADSDREIILQCGKLADLPLLVADAINICNASILLDASEGHNVEATSWARPTATVKLGYAGGIGPHNVTAVLDQLGDGAPFWIDMESGVRTDDQFDLVKVRSVLEQVTAWTERMPA